MGTATLVSRMEDERIPNKAIHNNRIAGREEDDFMDLQRGS